MENKLRGLLERAIVAALCQEALASGYRPVKVNDGGDVHPVCTTEDVLERVFAVDHSTVYFAPEGDPADDRFWARITLGNGEDCISEWYCGVLRFDEGGREGHAPRREQAHGDG